MAGGKAGKIGKNHAEALPGVLLVGRNDQTDRIGAWLRDSGWPVRHAPKKSDVLKHPDKLTEDIAVVAEEGSYRSALRFLRELDLITPGIGKVYLAAPDSQADPRELLNRAGIDHLLEAPVTQARLRKALDQTRNLLETRRIAFSASPRERELLTELRRHRTHLEMRMKQRTNELSRANRQLRKALKEIEDKNKALTTLNESLKIQSTTDPLTGLYNRREFMTRIRQEWGRYKRYARPISLIMLDIDHFKRINDTHGHECGDFVLRELGRLILQHKRAQDLCCRYGGEEFIVLLAETSLESAFHVAEGLRLLVADNTFNHKGTTVDVRISLGVSGVLEQDPKDVDAFINLADMAMYEAKNRGRNKTVIINAKKPQVVLRQTPGRTGRRAKRA